ncbi:hypothetical protein [Pseudobacteriovorax antillogorgiicola]|uniref:Uncharacterized protein n=1 Tax=Pseudobacteriovorax antillogorgiicola TaxID=1513793 RepID=A0A1Y6BMV4_9BACT|nr:hypothetical protein [Pseudobacteriovorax antillogorgiicola]TCS56188.1 hypothetical protein EDD56_10410 [Pseudobacteriovorax antillogorgiicola]SMF08876.1 hypothetical protein SAMN06296036_104324 [Pseudobacteriovorax antillogorgiicola]
MQRLTRSYTIFLLALGSLQACTDQEFGSKEKEAVILEEDDDDSVAIPQPITGAYLSCRVIQEPTNDANQAGVGCWLASETDDSKFQADGYDIQWLARLPEGSDDRVEIVSTVLASDAPFHVTHRLSGAPNPAALSTALESLWVGYRASRDTRELGEVLEPVSSSLERDPSARIPAFLQYRIRLTEMAAPCPNNTIGIEDLALSWNGQEQADSFSSLIDASSVNANQGTIGDQDVLLSSSNSFPGYFAYEAFGGGFGNGWWAEADAMTATTPSLARSDVYIQFDFIDYPGILLDGVYIDGGSSSAQLDSEARDYSSCAPSALQILASQDGETWITLRDIRSIVTNQRFRVPL